MNCRITKNEANAFVIGAMITGGAVGWPFLSMFTFISRKRAKELEAMQADFTDDEIALIKTAAEETEKQRPK